MAEQTSTQFLPASPRSAAAPLAAAPGAATPVAALVQSLTYSTPAARGRPGLVTTIGVMSIIIACLSGVATAVTAMQTFGFFAIAQMSTARAAAPAAAAAAPVVAGPGSSAPAAPATAPATRPTTVPANATATQLTAAEVQTVVQKVQASSATALNAAQVAGLQAQLQNPGQQLVSPGTAWSPVVAVHVDSGGAFVQLSGGWVQFDPQGQVVSQFSTANAFANFKMPMEALVLVAVDVVASFLLAILLLVAGIMVFRQSPRARPLHRLYAWLKIPVAVVGGVGMGWVFSAFVGNFSPKTAPGQGPSAEAVIFWMWAAGMGVLGIAYPVGLLITLRSRGVRAYYNSISGG